MKSSPNDQCICFGRVYSHGESLYDTASDDNDAVACRQADSLGKKSDAPASDGYTKCSEGQLLYRPSRPLRIPNGRKAVATKAVYNAVIARPDLPDWKEIKAAGAN